MDELTIDDKIYISSKRAAEITGYAKDYVGQLCREGRVEARLVGRSWYVLESSIRAHRFGGEVAKEPVQESHSQVSNWDSPTYEAEVVTPIAPLAPRKSVNLLDSEQSAPITVSKTESIEDMQSAWKEWFNTREDAPLAIETPEIIDNREAEAQRKEIEEQEIVSAPSFADPVPFTPVIEDIVPIRRTRIEQVSVQPAERTATEAPVKAPERHVRRRKQRTSYLALRTAMVAVATLVVLISMVGAGLLDEYLENDGVGYSVARYLGGAILINK